MAPFPSIFPPSKQFFSSLDTFPLSRYFSTPWIPYFSHPPIGFPPTLPKFLHFLVDSWQTDLLLGRFMATDIDPLVGVDPLIGTFIIKFASLR